MTTAGRDEGSLSVSRDVPMYVANSEADAEMGVIEREFDQLCRDVDEIADLKPSTWASNLGWATLGLGLATLLSLIPMTAASKDSVEAWGIVLMSTVGAMLVVIAGLACVAHRSLVQSRSRSVRRLRHDLNDMKRRAERDVVPPSE